MRDVTHKINNAPGDTGTMNDDDYNQVAEELENLIKALTPLDEADGRQVLKMVDRLVKTNFYYDSSIVPNQVVLGRAASSDPIETIIDGFYTFFKANNVNTGASTIKIGSLLTYPLFYNGIELAPGVLQLNDIYLAQYDLVNDRFNLTLLARQLIDYYTKLEADGLFYTQTQIDADIYKKTDIDSMHSSKVAAIAMSQGSVTLSETIQKLAYEGLVFAGRFSSPRADKPELVVSGIDWVGDFDVQADVDAWTLVGNGTLTLDPLGIKVLTTDGTEVSGYLPIVTVIGKRYSVEVDLAAINGNTGMVVTILDGIGGVSVGSHSITKKGLYRFNFDATVTTSYIYLQAVGTAGFYAVYDNVKVTEAVVDSSIDGTSIVEVGQTYWNDTGASKQVVARKPDGTLATLTIPDQEMLVNTGLGSEDFTSPTNGSGFHVVRGSVGKLGVHVNGVNENTTNGTFDTDITGWSLSAGSTVSWSAGAINAISTGVSNECFEQTVGMALENGKTYVVRYDVVAISGTTVISIDDPLTAQVITPALTVIAGSTVVYTFIAQGTTKLRFKGSGANSNITIDNISVKEAVTEGSIPANSSSLHLKGLTVISSTNLTDSLRGVKKSLYSESTNPEQTITTDITGLNSVGFTLGASVTLNAVKEIYLVTQEGYNNITFKPNPSGSFSVAAVNVITKRSITLYEGTAVYNHFINTFLNGVVNYNLIKGLRSTTDWDVQTDSGYRWNYNNNLAALNTLLHTFKPNGIILYQDTLTWNGANNIYIMYSAANSDTVNVSKYTASTSGTTRINTKFKPAKVIIKAIDIAEPNAVLTNVRDNFNSFTGLDSTAVEFSLNGAVTTHIDGLEFASAIPYMSSAGKSYIVIAFADTNIDGGGSYYDAPIDASTADATETTDVTTSDYTKNLKIYQSTTKILYTCINNSTTGTLLTNATFFKPSSSVKLTDSVLDYCIGLMDAGFNNRHESFAGDILIPYSVFNGAPDGESYIYKLRGLDTFKLISNLPAINTYVKDNAADNRLVFNTATGKWHIATGDELITNGDFQTGDLTGWNLVSANTATATVVNNELNINTIDVSQAGAVAQSFATVIGVTYIIKILCPFVTFAGSAVLIGNAGLDSSLANYDVVTNGVTDIEIEFTAVDTTTFITLVGTTVAATTVVYDNITIFNKTPILDNNPFDPLGDLSYVPISFINRKFTLLSETPQEIVEWDCPTVVMEDTHIARLFVDEVIFNTPSKPYVDYDAVGPNPTAVIYGDGTIYGKTDYGEYLKYPNGVLKCFKESLTPYTTNVTNGNVFYSGVTPTLYYPHFFITNPITTPYAHRKVTGAANIGWASMHVSTSEKVAMIYPIAGVLNSVLGVGYFAIGRWK